jgi:hypothetical protein
MPDNLAIYTTYATLVEPGEFARLDPAAKCTPRKDAAGLQW